MPRREDGHLPTIGLLNLPDELLAAAVAHLPEDDKFAAALTCTRLRKAVVSSERRITASLARTSTSIGSVFGSLAKLQWALSCGLSIDLQLARKAESGPREHLLLLLDTLPRLPLMIGLNLTELDIVQKGILASGAIRLGKALEVSATLTKLNLRSNMIGDNGATGLGKALKVNATLVILGLCNNRIGNEGAIRLGKAL
jgi:hypothetical protein